MAQIGEIVFGSESGLPGVWNGNEYEKYSNLVNAHERAQELRQLQAKSESPLERLTKAAKLAGGTALPVAGSVGGAALGAMTGPAAPVAAPTLEALGGMGGEVLAQKMGLAEPSGLNIALAGGVPFLGRIAGAASKAATFTRNKAAKLLAGFLPEEVKGGKLAGELYKAAGKSSIPESSMTGIRQAAEGIEEKTLPRISKRIRPETIPSEEAKLLEKEAALSRSEAGMSAAERAELESAKAELDYARAELARKSENELGPLRARVLEARAALSEAKSGALAKEISEKQAAKAGVQDVKSQAKSVLEGMSFEEADDAVKALGREASRVGGSEGNKLFALREAIVKEIDAVNPGYTRAAKVYHRQESVSRLEEMLVKEDDPAKAFAKLRAEGRLTGPKGEVLREGQDITMRAFDTKELDEIQGLLKQIPKRVLVSELIFGRIVGAGLAGAAAGYEAGRPAEGAAIMIALMLVAPYGRRFLHELIKAGTINNPNAVATAAALTRAIYARTREL